MSGEAGRMGTTRGVDGIALLVVLLTGLASAAAFHAGGALDARDALAAASLRDGTAASRTIALGVDLLRLIDVRIGLFRAAHLAAGILLAVAAAFVAAVAARIAGSALAGLAAALLAGTAIVFGADSGRFGLEAGAVAPLLAALSGAAWAWTGSRPRPGAGGLLLGAGVAVHPAAILALPGFLLLARGLPAGTRVRAALGFVAGLALLHLPPPGGAWGGALDAWWSGGGDGAWWSPAGIGDWTHGARWLAGTLWRGGPVTLAAGIAGAVLAVRGGAAAGGARAFLAVLVPVVLALIVATRPDPALAVLAAWSLALLAAPAVAAVANRMPGAAAALPGAALAAGAGLLAMNLSALDRSEERGTEWALDSIAPLPEGALLLTANPVHVALSADGARPEVELRMVSRTAPGETRELLRAFSADRKVFLDASLFFDARWRAAALGDEFVAVPEGLAFQVIGKGRRLRDPESTDWSRMHLETDYPPSPLRDGLGTRDFYARSLLQSAFLRFDLDYEVEAEHEFLYALSYPPCNRSLAAMGLARIFLARRDPGSAIRTLETFVRPEDEGAWSALQVLGSAYSRAQRPQEAVDAYRRALSLVPAQLDGERARIEQSITALEKRLRPGG